MIGQRNQKGFIRIMYFVYMVRCRDHSLYTGTASDVEARIRKHNDGKGARYTRGRGPVELVYVEEVADKSAALKREYVIKQYSKEKKERLVEIWKNKDG
jgi:putative endonuclease